MCIGTAPDIAGCYYNRALAYAALDRPGQALQDYDRALALDPAHATAALNRGMLHYQLGRPAGALADLRQAEAEALTQPGWVDQAKGIVRLPITNAMDMVLRDWQNPPAARSNLMARVEKATFVPPPPPQTPSDFE